MGVTMLCLEADMATYGEKLDFAGATLHGVVLLTPDRVVRGYGSDTM